MSLYETEHDMDRTHLMRNWPFSVQSSVPCLTPYLWSIHLSVPSINTKISRTTAFERQIKSFTSRKVVEYIIFARIIARIIKRSAQSLNSVQIWLPNDSLKDIKNQATLSENDIRTEFVHVS